MVPRHRLFAVSSLVAAGFLSACATPSENVITRAWQVDHALDDMEHECRFHAISESVTDEISKRIDAEQVFEELWQACPDLMLASLSDGEGDANASSEMPTRSIKDSDDIAGGASVNDGSSGSGAGSAGSSSNGSAGDSRSGESASGEGSGGNGSEGGSASGSGAGTSGSDSSGDSKGNGRGSSANNGGGNGSEGSSPGRGRGANVDE